jgi:hypothetical protein
LPLAGRQTYSTFSIDPQNFLRTRSLGLSPHNTTLTINYRVGGGSATNVPARSVRQASNAVLSFPSTNLNTTTLGAVEGSIGCLNLASMTGGGESETIREIKANAAAFFAAQNRIVTREDIIARAYSIPAPFGMPARVYAKPSLSGRYAFDLHMLSYDSTGNLVVATPTLKSNMATYLSKFKMLTDGINILDADILDLRVYFGVTVTAGSNASQVLLNCTNALTSYFAQGNLQIGQPIVVSNVVAVLDGQTGVQAVTDVSFTNVYGITDGLQYSDDRFNISQNLQNGMLVCPPEATFQVKFPTKDIVGSAS